jgi:chlorite dismutase
MILSTHGCKTMKLFKTPDRTWDDEERALLTKAANRVAKCSAEQMLQWADASASEIMKAVEDFMSTENTKALDELTYAVITLQAVVKELRVRHLLTHEV